jgi:hypothetical protein
MVESKVQKLVQLKLGLGSAHVQLDYPQLNKLVSPLSFCFMSLWL